MEEGAQEDEVLKKVMELDMHNEAIESSQAAITEGK